MSYDEHYYKDVIWHCIKSPIMNEVFPGTFSQFFVSCFLDLNHSVWGEIKDLQGLDFIFLVS